MTLRYDMFTKLLPTVHIVPFVVGCACFLQPLPALTEESSPDASGELPPQQEVGELLPPQEAWGEGAAAAPAGDDSAPEASSGTEAPSAALLDKPTAEADDAPKKGKKKKKKRKVRVSARIHTRWHLAHEPTKSGDDELSNDFSIRRARFKLRWKPEKWLLAVFHVGEFHKTNALRQLLRDAYIHASPLRFLEFRAGLFKKPFSRLQLRSSGKLRVVDRGPGNDLILDDLRFGERDIGVQLSGRLVPSIKLDYMVGAFNGSNLTGSGRELGDEKDVVARLAVQPFDWLDIGANGSFKFFSEQENPNGWAWAAGVDGTLELFDVRLHLEGLMAENPTYNVLDPDAERPKVLNGVGILSYKRAFEGAVDLAIEPVFKFEVLDPDIGVVEDEVFVFSAGLNTHLGDYFRIMIHGEFQRHRRNTPVTYPKRDDLYVQLCFDI